jgi:hypothetical protein
MRGTSQRLARPHLAVGPQALRARVLAATGLGSTQLSHSDPLAAGPDTDGAINVALMLPRV